VLGGKFTEAKGTGDSVQVNVKVTGAGRLALLDSQANTLVGKSFRCEADEGLIFFVAETGTEVVWKLRLDDYLAKVLSRQPLVEVVTGVSLGPKGLQVTKRMVRVLSVGAESQDAIPTVGC
jgi:hypothetical protein